MRTTLDIDDTLLAEAMAITGQTTAEATTAEALRRVRREQLDRQKIAGEPMAGFGWDGDLDGMERHPGLVVVHP